MVGIGSLLGCSSSGAGKSLSTVGNVDFRTPLPVPPLLEPVVRDGRQLFDMVIQEGKSSLAPGGDATTWGINGPFLGPTVRASRGDDVRVDIRNDLDVATTIHWHGMHVPSWADGGPHSTIGPGKNWSPEWTVDQPAATLWYHPHPHGETEVHAYKGLGGFFLVDDDDAPDGLPSGYGVDDVPLVVQDKTFDDAGELVETDRNGVGMLGDTVLVNGAVGPTFGVTAERTRLRLLNGSTARSYCFGLSGDREFTVIATDGGLLEKPVDIERILLTPGERVEVVVTMQAGETLVLRSFPHDLGVNSNRNTEAGADDELDILELVAASQLTASPELPSALAPLPAPEEKDAVVTRTFDLGNNRINNLAMDMSRVDAEVAANTVEIWEVENTHSQPHNFHVHDVQFRILDIDGEVPPPELSGLKDTVYTPPGKKFRLIMKFGDNPTPDIPYMFHCHLLWHEDEGMMGQFTVGDFSGTVAESVTGAGGGHHSH